MSVWVIFGKPQNVCLGNNNSGLHQGFGISRLFSTIKDANIPNLSVKFMTFSPLLLSFIPQFS